MKVCREEVTDILLEILRFCEGHPRTVLVVDWFFLLGFVCVCFAFLLVLGWRH